MVGDEGTLATTAEVLLAIGANPSTAQALEANTNTWIKQAESDMEKAFGNNIGLVANHATITAALKPWLSLVSSTRAAFHAINQDQNNWGLATTESKLAVLDSIWTGFLSDLIKNKSGIIADLNLS